MSQQTFNAAELATWDEARELAKKLSSGPITVGGGVKPENRNALLSGIYIPDWFSGPTGFEAPHHKDPATGEESLYLHFRFQNGAEGMNVGLIKDRFHRYPSSPGYVLLMLANEADSIAQG